MGTGPPAGPERGGTEPNDVDCVPVFVPGTGEDPVPIVAVVPVGPVFVVGAGAVLLVVDFVVPI